MIIKYTRDKYSLYYFDYVWLVYYIVIYTFNCAFDNMQMLSTIALFGASLLRESFKKYNSSIRLSKSNMNSCSVWYGVFFAFVAISYFWSSAIGIKHINMVTSLVQILVFFICVDWYVKSERELTVLMKCFCYATLFFAVVVLATSPVSTYNSLEFGAFTGMHRNTTGYILMFGCFFDLYYGKRFSKKYFYLMAIICFVVSLLTGSRKIIIGYLFAIAAFVFFQKNLKKFLRYLLLVIIMAIVIIPIGYQIPYIQETFGERMIAVFDEDVEDGSVEARDRAKELAVELFNESPVVGKGWNAVNANYGDFYDKDMSIYAHNNYLEIAADFGIIGIILFYWKFFTCTLFGLRNARKNDLATFLLICLVTVLILDVGQVTYLYLYMMTVCAILFKGINVLQKDSKGYKKIAED